MANKKVVKQLQPQAQAPDRWIAYGTLPLRVFLGLTFLYAGVQKIADPGFFQPGSATYIGTQLQGFSAHSPIGFLIDVFALPSPEFSGAAVISAELLIGALVLAGLATSWAAAAGAATNLVFFLTASWSVQPYFLGSDSIYVVAWITLAIVGDQGIWTVRPLLFGPQGAQGGSGAVDLERRRILVVLGGAAVAAVWVLGVLPRPKPTLSVSAPTASPAASATPVASPVGTRVGALADLQSQGFLNFQDPKSGDPAVAVALSGGRVAAFDAICTHAGCQVGYDSSQKLLSCPCHGALFDPAHGAAVVRGPAPDPLASIPVQIGSDGGLYTD